MTRAQRHMEDRAKATMSLYLKETMEANYVSSKITSIHEFEATLIVKYTMKNSPLIHTKIYRVFVDYTEEETLVAVEEISCRFRLKSMNHEVYWS